MQISLKTILKGRVIIVGVGNIMRGDDGFGPRLIERLKGSAKAVCLDVGTVPENYIGKIAKAKPDTILIVDAVHLDKLPGEYEILRKEDISRSGFTTHNLSPAMFIEHLENETKADIYMLGVQPEKITFGSSMSESIEKLLIKISSLIINLL